MCFNGKQIVNALAAICIATGMMTQAVCADAPRGTAGGVAVGEGSGGVTDRAFILAPPNYVYVVEKSPGSFLDCGDGQEIRTTDNDGRDMAIMRCGVTLTETIVIPAAAESARIIVHY